MLKLFLSVVFLYASPEQYSIQTANSTIGQKLLGLQYANDEAANWQEFWMTRKQKLFYALLTIGGPWLEERIDDVTAIKIPHLKKVCSF